MNFKTQLRAGTLLAGLFCASGAWAQDQPPATTPTQATASTGSAAAAVDDAFGDIVVTARRREENAQTVPVSVTAFSGAALEQRNVRELRDLNAVTPGLRFTNDGGKNTTTVTLRGLGRNPLGEGVPSVVTYFADVALIGDGVNIPTYDIANIQVLKGPQGTLFGRNTLGGAVVIKPAAPTYDLGGYVRGEYGRYDYRTIEGALNVPLLNDRAALRVAGQIRRQDGSAKNLSGGPDFNDIHQNSFRASLLIEPFEGFTNTTIYDYFKADEEPGALYLYEHHPGVIPGLSAALDGQIAAYFQGQREHGFHSAYSQMGQGVNPPGAAYRRLWGVTNDSKLEIGEITLRNIFGYRESSVHSTINTGGVGPVTVGGLPFTLFIADSMSQRSYLSNEFQVIGNALDDRLDFIFGAFYNHDKPTGAGGSHFTAFSTTGLSPFITGHVVNTNTALFGQIGYKLTDQLTLNAGLRYSWDKVLGCGGAGGASYLTLSACKGLAAQDLIDGVGVIRNKGDAPSWTIGLDFQATDDLFLYVTSRRGNRGVNVNTPLFETPFTTGGTGCARGSMPVTCPDLRPFQNVDKETVTDVEIGTKWDWTAGDVRGRLNIAGFYSKYKGALQFFNVTASGIPNSAPDYPTRQSIGINAADETIKGIELEAVFIPTRGLTFNVNAAFTDTNIDKVIVPSIAGVSLTKADVTKPTARFTSTVAVNWILPVRPFDSELVFNADYFHTSKWGAQVGRNLPKYDLVNARVALNEIAGSGLSFALSVRNLFNEHYYTAASNLGLTFPTSTVYTGDQRMWAIEGKYRF